MSVSQLLLGTKQSGGRKMGGSEPGSAVATEIGDDSVWDLLDMNYEVRVGLGEVEEPSAEAETTRRPLGRTATSRTLLACPRSVVTKFQVPAVGCHTLIVRSSELEIMASPGRT